MIAAGIVEVFNKQLQSLGAEKSHLVLYKTKESGTVKAYKKYIWKIYCMYENKIVHIIAISYTAREVNELEEHDNILAMEKKLLASLYNLLLDNNLLKSIIDGKLLDINTD